MISIFKTNISSDDLTNVGPHLNGLLTGQIWSIDLWDCDKILRVDSFININEEIKSVLHRLGYICVHLETFYTKPS
ncbi:hypothetical protein [Pedobacter mucosus]|uniref:hypothetical protein n=1 Tax=Pedobacter mucosus TaxID=2895286 RepID=UPI001EE4BA53|nr:hypothetical protein [Pedobacter mucosus]UKT65848.1 hypothetical protein LOK61_08655 [Pedobacter mucosus]